MDFSRHISVHNRLWRGLFDVAALNAMHAKMHKLTGQLGGRIDAVFFCPHTPDDQCDCRKPLPGMMLEIARRYGADLADVPMVGDTLREQGLAVPAVGGGTTFLQAKTANEVLKAQERRIRLQKLKGELIERDRTTALVFRIAREERDSWVNWPARAAALMAADLGVEPAAMQKALEKHVRAHLDELAEVRPDFR